MSRRPIRRRQRQRLCPAIEHHALVDLTSQVALEATDDLLLAQAFRGAPGDVRHRWFVEPHPDDDRAIQSGVGLTVTAAIETVPTVGHARARRDGADRKS